MPTPGGLVTKQELIDAQDDTRHLGEVSNGLDASGNPIDTSVSRLGEEHLTVNGMVKLVNAAISQFGLILPAIQYVSGDQIVNSQNVDPGNGKYAINQVFEYNGALFVYADDSSTLPYTLPIAFPGEPVFLAANVAVFPIIKQYVPGDVDHPSGVSILTPTDSGGNNYQITGDTELWIDNARQFEGLNYTIINNESFQLIDSVFDASETIVIKFNIYAQHTPESSAAISSLRYPSEFGGVVNDTSATAQASNDAAFLQMKAGNIKFWGFEGTYYSSQQLSFLDTDATDWDGITFIGFGEQTGISCLTPGTHALLLRGVKHSLDMLKLSSLTTNDDSTPNGYALQWRQVKDSSVGTLWLNNGWWFGEYDPADPRDGSQRNNINNINIENARYWALYLRSFGITDKTKGTLGNNFNNITIKNSNAALTLDGGDGGANAAVHSNNFNNYVADSCDTGFHCETSNDNNFSNVVLLNPTNNWSTTGGVTPYKQKFLYSFSQGNRFNNCNFGEYEGEFFAVPSAICKNVLFDSCTQKAAWVFSNTSQTEDDTNKNCFTGFRFSNHRGLNSICLLQNTSAVNTFNNWFRDWTFENSEYDGLLTNSNIVNIQNSVDVNINDRTIFRDCGNVVIRSENLKWQDGSKYRSYTAAGSNRLILVGTGPTDLSTLHFEGDYAGEDSLEVNGFDIIALGNCRFIGQGASQHAIEVGTTIQDPVINVIGNLVSNYPEGSFSRDIANLYGLRQLPTPGLSTNATTYIRDYRDGSIVEVTNTSTPGINCSATAKKYDAAWKDGTEITVFSSTGNLLTISNADIVIGSNTGLAYKICQINNRITAIQLQ